VTLNGWIGENPVMPASLKGCAEIGKRSCPYQVSAPSTGWNGINSGGYGDKSDACFFSFIEGLSQCSSSYEVPGRIAEIHQGPVKAY
jgi:hypothetical protein